MNFGLSVYPFGFLLGACFWRRLALTLALCLFLAGGAGAVPVNPANFTPAATPAATAKPDAASDTKPAEDKKNPPVEESIAGIRNNLAKSCFGGPIIAFGFAVPFIFGEKLHETFAPYVSGILMIVFAIWAYLKVGSALLPFGPKDQAAALFNAIGVRFFVVLGVSVFLLAPTTGYTAYRDYIITPILSAGTTIVDKMYQIGVETNPTLARFAKEDGQCTPTPIKGLDAKLTAIKDDLECKVCMIQRAYSYPWSYGLFQVGNGKIFTGLLLMLVGIAPFLMFLFTVADVFMVRIGYVSCTLSAYAAAGCFPASRKYAITGLKSLSDGAMVLITSMIAAMISISMLTTVIENLDKGGQGDFAADVKPSPETPKATPLSAPLSPSGTVPFASNVQTPTTTYATGPMGANTPNGTYASWYRNTHLRQPPPPQNTGFDTFRETPLAGSTLGDVPVACPMVYANGQCVPLTSGMGYPQEFGAWTSFRRNQDGSPRQHVGQDYDCAQDYALRPITNCRVILHQNGYFTCRVMNGAQDTMVTFRYLHGKVFNPIPVNTVISPSKLVGYCSRVRASAEHLHLEVEICDNLSSGESLARMRAKYPASGVSGGIPFVEGSVPGGSTGRNCYLVHPNFFVKGAMAFSGVEGAGFSAVATNFKNFGILDKGFLLVLVICIVSLQVSKQAGKFTSGQGMGVFMKALGQMITGVIQTLGAVVTVGAKAAEMAAPLAGAAMGAAGGMVGGALQATGLDKAVNRAAEGVQKTFDNVTQQLAGTLENAGFNVGSMLSGAQRSLSNTQQEVIERVAEFEQGIRDLAAGIQSRESVQRVMKMLAPGVAVLTFATKNVAMPVGREILLPAAGAVAGNTLQTVSSIAFDPNDDLGLRDVNLAGELQNVRENLAKAPLSEAPARDAAAPAGEQQEGLVLVRKASADLNRTAEGTSSPDQDESNTTGERQATNNYQRLGLEEGATFDQVKEAYRDLAKQYHPDGNGNQTEQEKRGFQEITAAYNVIKNDRMGLSRGDVQGATPQEIVPETPRQLSGTTVAPMPRGDTEGSRAQESSWQNLENDRKSLEDNYNYPSYQKDADGADSGDPEDTPSFDSRPKEKEDAKPVNTIVSARGLRDNNKKTRSDIVSEGRKRASSVARGVPINQILAVTGYEASEAEMAAVADRLREEAKNVAANNINTFQRSRVPTPTGPKSRK